MRKYLIELRDDKFLVFLMIRFFARKYLMRGTGLMRNELSLDYYQCLLTLLHHQCCSSLIFPSILCSNLNSSVTAPFSGLFVRELLSSGLPQSTAACRYFLSLNEIYSNRLSYPRLSHRNTCNELISVLCNSIAAWSILVNPKKSRPFNRNIFKVIGADKLISTHSFLVWFGVILVH